MTRSATIFTAVFILSLAASLGQGFFYWPQASPAEGGTVNSAIASKAQDSIVEHYQAVPAPGYVFDSWSLYPRGEHGYRLCKYQQYCKFRAECRAYSNGNRASNL